MSNVRKEMSFEQFQAVADGLSRHPDKYRFEQDTIEKIRKDLKDKNDQFSKTYLSDFLAWNRDVKVSDFKHNKDIKHSIAEPGLLDTLNQLKNHFDNRVNVAPAQKQTSSQPTVPPPPRPSTYDPSFNLEEAINKQEERERQEHIKDKKRARVSTASGVEPMNIYGDEKKRAQVGSDPVADKPKDKQKMTLSLDNLRNPENPNIRERNRWNSFFKRVKQEAARGVKKVHSKAANIKVKVEVGASVFKKEAKETVKNFKETIKLAKRPRRKM